MTLFLPNRGKAEKFSRKLAIQSLARPNPGTAEPFNEQSTLEENPH
jgi:hypothetical protein